MSHGDTNVEVLFDYGGGNRILLTNVAPLNIHAAVKLTSAGYGCVYAYGDEEGDPSCPGAGEGTL